MIPGDPQSDPRAWDDMAITLGVNPDNYVAARERLGFPRPFGPSRKASPRCKSGKRDYCTCDTCF